MRKLLLSAALTTGCAAPAPPPSPPAPPPVVQAAPALPARVHVQLLALNDFHGNLEAPHGHDGTVLVSPGVAVAAGGAAYLAAHVRRLAQDNPNTIVVSAGDLTGASPLVSNLFADEPTVLVMNRLGLDFAGVGNHDFDRGLGELERLQHGGARAIPGIERAGEPFPGAKYHYLAANVLGSDGKPVFPAYAIREVGGVKVAFIGMTLRGTPSVTTKVAIQGLTFENEAKTANALLPELRAAGVATTVLLLHEGGFQEEGGTLDSCKNLRGDIMPVLAELDPAFRVVVTAHTHQAYNCKIDGRTVTSAASYGRVVTAIDLSIDPGTRELTDVQAHNVPVTRNVEPDAEVLRIVSEYEALARPVTDRVVGYQKGPLTRDPRAGNGSCETPLGDLIADAELQSTRKAGAQIAFMNPGGIRTDLLPDASSESRSAIRYASAFEVQPFGNRLVTVTLTGEDLHTLLVRQFGHERPRVLSPSRGFTYRYAVDKATKAVTVDAASMRLDGKPIDPRGKYRVTVSSFLADGGDGFGVFAGATNRVPGELDIEALVAYLGQKSSVKAPLAPPPLDRIGGGACR